MKVAILNAYSTTDKTATKLRLAPAFAEHGEGGIIDDLDPSSGVTAR